MIHTDDRLDVGREQVGQLPRAAAEVEDMTHLRDVPLQKLPGIPAHRMVDAAVDAMGRLMREPGEEPVQIEVHPQPRPRWKR